MALKFDDILARRAGRRVETKDQGLVEQLASHAGGAAREPRPCAASGKAPAMRRPASCARGPLMRMTAIAAGGRPLDSAKMRVASRAMRA